MRKFLVITIAALIWSTLSGASLGQDAANKDNMDDIIKRVTQSATDHKERVVGLRKILNDNFASIENADQALEAMKSSVQALLDEVKLDGEIDTLLKQYIEFANGEKQRLLGDDDLKHLAVRWDPKIERTEALRERYAILEAKLTAQLEEIEKRSKVIVALARLEEYEEALSAAEGVADELETISDELAVITDKSKEIERGDGAAQ